jgi:hypothetical protein
MQSTSKTTIDWSQPPSASWRAMSAFGRAEIIKHGRPYRLEFTSLPDQSCTFIGTMFGTTAPYATTLKGFLTYIYKLL